MLHCLIILSLHDSFSLCVFNNDLNFLNSPIFIKNKSFIEKTPPTKVEGFQMSIFDLIQTWEIPFIENI